MQRLPRLGTIICALHKVVSHGRFEPITILEITSYRAYTVLTSKKYFLIFCRPASGTLWNGETEFDATLKQYD